MAGSRFSLEAVLTLNDQLTSQYRQSTRQIAALSSNASRSITRMNDSINRSARRVIAGGLIAVGAGIALAAREFIALDESITQAGAKFKDLDTTSADYAQTLETLSMAARDVGRVTEFSATDAAGALDKMAMAGLRSDQSMALLMQTTNLATAANVDLTTAVDIATDSLGAFNLMVDDAAQLETNLTRISDVMAKTTTTANTSLEDMFESVKAGAPAFTAAGQSVESFAALTGVMANAGVKGAMAGTNLRNIMLRLADPTSEAARQLEALGVTTADEAGNFRDVIDILADFESGLEGMGTQQKTAALATVFGARAVTGVNILLAEGSDALREYRGELIDSAGASRTMAEAMRSSIGNRLKVIKSGLTELGLQFIDAFDEKGKEGLERLTVAIQNFDMKPIINGATRLVDAIVKLVENFDKWAPILKTVGILFAAWIVSVKLFMAIQIAQKIIVAVQAFMALAKAQGILNILMSANPIGLIIIGIAALIAIVILAVKHWDKISAAMGIAWEWIKKNKEMLLAFLGPIGLVIAAIINIAQRWDEVKAAFAEGGILGAIKAIGKIIWDTIVAPIQQIIALAKSIIPNAERREERRDRRDERQAARRGDEPAQAAAVQQQRITEESRQRNDVFLHAPMGGGLSATPGGAPEPAVRLGAQ